MNHLVTIDNDPYFIQALKYGRQKQLIEPEQIEEMKSKGISFSVLFCKKYFKSLFVSDLKQGAYNVLSILSLGLYEQSGGDLGKSVSLLQEVDFSEIYGLGKERVDEYYEKYKKNSELSVGVTPAFNEIFDDIFPNYYSPKNSVIEMFDESMEMMDYTLSILEYYEYLKVRFYADDDQGYITGIYFTPLISLVLESGPKGYLAESDLDSIQRQLMVSESQFSENLKTKIKQFKEKIPREYHRIFDEKSEEFFQILRGSFMPLLKQGNFLQQQVHVDEDLQDYDPYAYLEQEGIYQDLGRFLELDIQSFY